MEREGIGLEKNFVDIKDPSKDPGLAYVTEPEIKTKKDLEHKRKIDNFEDMKHAAQNQGNHVDGMT